MFLGESQSHIYPNMCAKFGCGPTVVSKGGWVGTDRQTDKGTLRLYIEQFTPARMVTIGLLLATQHTPVVFIVRMQKTRKMRMQGLKTIKWWKCTEGMIDE